jgi:hypothetical protein
MLSTRAEAAGLRARKASKLEDQAFRALAERVLADDILSVTEERELLAVAAALGLDQNLLQSRFSDLMQQLVVAQVNDGRLPQVPQPHLMTKADEVVHFEAQAALLKEVVHREYRGGGGGISVPLGLGVRFGTGGFRGRSVVIGTSLEPTDIGVLSVTDRRLVYQGQKKTQESRFDRLVGVEIFSDGLRVSVSNRENSSLYRVGAGPVVGAIINAAYDRA